MEDQNVSKKTSKELLNITKDGSRKTVIQSLMKKPITKPTKLKTFKTDRSPLFDQLEKFLPKIKQSTNEIMKKTEEERNKLDIENVDGCNKVVEMNILMGQMDRDSSSSSSSEDEEAKPSVTEANLKLPNQHSLTDDSDGRACAKLITEIDDVDIHNCSPASEESR